MEELVAILLVVLVLIFVLPILTLVSQHKLKKRLETLERRFAGLETAQAAATGQTGFVSEPQPMPPPMAEEPSSDDISTDEAFPVEEPEPEFIPDSETIPADAPPQISLSMNEATAAPEAPPRRSTSVEQAFGTRWLVWIGGIALALGGIFLVRYSIEAGLVGPGVRIALGGLFAVALGLVGEFARRRDLTANLAGVPSAYIPGVLTAASTMTAFATVYTAYAVYGFLPPLAAFVLLAACSFAALSASFLHGPGLAALGLVASLATPALVSSQAPQAWPLFGYLAVVTGTAYFAARLKGWLWLAVSATVGAVLWGLVWQAGNWSSADVAPLGFFVLVLMGLALYFLTHHPEGPETDDAEADSPVSIARLLTAADWPAAGILMGITFLVFPLVRLEAYSTPALFLLAAVVAVLISSAWHWRNLAPLTLWASLLFCSIYLVWHFPVLVTEPVGPLDAFLGLPNVLPPPVRHFLIVGGLFGAGFAAAGLANTFRGGTHPFWTAMSASTPLVIFAYAYYRATGFLHDVPFGLFALGMAAAYIAISDQMLRAGALQFRAWRSGAYAASAVISLAFAMTILLEKGWLTISLALIAPGLAWVASKRPLPGLRYLAAGVAAVVMARLVYDPIIIGSDLGTTPILNWLLYGYGVPALAFLSAAWMFRKHFDDIAVQILEAAGILCIVALFGLQIRHALNDGNVYSATFDLAELSIHSITMLGLAIGLQSIYDRTGRTTVQWASAILGLASLAAILFGHLVFENPMLTGDSIGEGRIFNLLILAYAVPALLCLPLYKLSAGKRPQLYVTAIGVTALVLFFTYLTLETRALFQGPILSSGTTSDTEWYTYSAVWLAYGALLLGLGVVTGKAAVRYASLAVIILTVGKVFLSDLAHLSGILRALSFIGLGAVLVGIGFFYQRFVFPQGGEDSDGQAEAVMEET